MRVNEKIAQFCVTGKKRTEVVLDPSPQIVAIVRREREEKREAGTPRDLHHIVRTPKSNTERIKEFRERKKTRIKSSRKRDQKKQKNSANPSSATAKSRSEYMREYRARKKTLQNTLLMPSLMTNDGNAIETLLMTAQINTDFVNPPVPSTTELSTSLVRVETDSCESIINYILPYKDNDSHKNGTIPKDFQKRFVDNPFGHGCSICDRLWFRDDLRTPVAEHKNILPGINFKDIKACYNCRQSLSRKSIPNLSKYNCFVYPEIPAHLFTLDLVSERLISPRIPFVQIQ
ncbi:uncharacterized protein TNCV_614561 [Trichonephila clavipes]|nr:uncharacterized protein TNCV_614561 [Trichonephila clavipes]